MAFDINDRATWAWIDDAVAESRANNEYLLNPQDKTSFYQFSNGVPYKHYCSIIDEKGTRQVFNPPVNACDWPKTSPKP